MNIERGLAQLGGALAGEARSSTPPGKDDSAPAFSLPEHTTATATSDTERRRTMQEPRTPRERMPANAPRETADTHSAEATSHATRRSESAADDAPHTAPRPGHAAAARGESRNTEAPRRDSAGDGKARVPSEDATATQADGRATEHGRASDDDTLPDRMLALLQGEPLPSANAPIAMETAAVAGLPTGQLPGAAGDARPTDPAPLAIETERAARAGLHVDGRAPPALDMPLMPQRGAATPMASLHSMASDTIATPAVHGDAAQTIYPATKPPGASPVTAETLPKAAQGADAPSIAGRQVMASIAADLAAASPVTATPASPAHAGAFDGFASLTAFGRTRDGTTAAVDAAPDSGFAPLLVRGAEALQGAARAAPVVAPTPLPLVLVLDADFDDGLGARVTWMAEQRIDHAQIRVSPEALGPIDVRLQMDGHRVNAQFHAASPDVRQALESGMDRLRDMLGRQGMELGQAQVGSGARQGADSHAGGGWQGHGGSAGADGPAPVQPSMRVALRPSRGLLDEYA